jgi:hypothetical protein
MTPPPHLTGSHLRTFQKIFQHPISHNLDWREVRGLLENLGQLTEEPNGNLRATWKGRTLVLHPSSTKDVSEMDEVMALRHFLTFPEAAPPEAGRPDTDWLLVIDHHEALIFRSEMHGSVPRAIVPYEPYGFFRHAHKSRDFSRGEEKPDPNTFFEPVSKALQAAARILVFGTGTGMGSEMEQFTTWLASHHPEIAARVIGSVVVDESHLTPDQLLAKAREFYATLPEAVAP